MCYIGMIHTCISVIYSCDGRRGASSGTNRSSDEGTSRRRRRRSPDIHPREVQHWRRLEKYARKSYENEKRKAIREEDEKYAISKMPDITITTQHKWLLLEEDIDSYFAERKVRDPRKKVKKVASAVKGSCKEKWRNLVSAAAPNFSAA